LESLMDGFEVTITSSIPAMVMGLRSGSWSDHRP